MSSLSQVGPVTAAEASRPGFAVENGEQPDAGRVGEGAQHRHGFFEGHLRIRIRRWVEFSSRFDTLRYHARMIPGWSITGPGDYAPDFELQHYEGGFADELRAFEICHRRGLPPLRTSGTTHPT